MERLVAAMDVDGDGKVTYQEYLNSFRYDSTDFADRRGGMTIMLIMVLMAKFMLIKGNSVRSSRAKGVTFTTCFISWLND